ncbi:tachykinin-like peptides receptor 86C [Cydia fagiglandana]|uniref:tachykinin-like peptides receptor 86C n=1 Tax=Cydia fagiglandana TaxID=1458189 RepID=UPI002FEE3B56
MSLTETWCLYKTDIKKLDTYHLRCLRSILRIKWQDHVPNSEVLRRSGMYGMEAILMQRQLRWCGHVLRMDDHRLPKAVLYSELAVGKRKHGGQHLRYKDVLKRHLSACAIDPEHWEELAGRRSSWRSTIHNDLTTMSLEHVNFNFTTVLIYGYNVSYLNGTSNNMTSIPGDSASPSDDFEPLPLGLKRLFYALFTIIVVLAIVLNSMVIGIVVCVGKMRRNPTNCPILTLAIADLLLSVCNTPWNSYAMLEGSWHWSEDYELNEYLCKMNQFLSNAFIAASVFTLLATSIDRYRVICKPLGTTQSKGKMATIMVGIVAVSFTVCVPNYIYFHLYRVHQSTRYVCKWDEELEMAYLVYNILYFIFTYLLPFLSMAYCYYCICILLWDTRDIVERNDAQCKIQKDRKRTIKMLICVVSSFATCWLPFHVYFLVEGFWSSVKLYRHSRIVYISLYWLAMLNSTLNPVIYYWLLPK